MDSHLHKMVKAGSSTSDLITDLPDNVIQNILVHLPIRDALRTSVLSRKWRCKWRDLPSLEFDKPFWRLSSNKEVGRLEVLLNIYHVLLLHHGPITKFTLNVPNLPSCPEIGRLIFYLCDKDVQELSLFSYRGVPYKIPSCLFSYKQLRHLELSRCEIKAPPHGGISRLISLKLYEVDFQLSECNTFISECPLLECLVFVKCLSFMRLEIDAPNLKSLRIKDNGIYFCLKSTLLLGPVMYVSAGEFLSAEVRPLKWIEFCKCLPALENLAIDCLGGDNLADEELPKMVSTASSHLRFLELYSIRFNDAAILSWTLCMILNSPNLQELRIEVGKQVVPLALGPSALKLFEAQDLLCCSLEKLQVVRIESFSGVSTELEFVKFLLAKSVALGELLLQVSDESFELGVLRAVTQFPRASARAEVRVFCKDSNPHKIMAVGVLNLDDLPDSIIEKILTHLPIRDAAKTSILSKKWRNHWRNIPALVFDDSFTRPEYVEE